MESSWNERVYRVLSKGISLSPIGVNNFAFSKELALDVLEELRSLGVAILGGDVYVESGGMFESNYDNWYCKKLDDESVQDFVARSGRDAEKYIQGYGAKGAFFVFVPDGRSL